MRLIDAMIQPKSLTDYILERKSTFIRVLEEGDNEFLLALLTNYFTEQPTAYDVDKVINQMEKDKFIDCETILSDIHQGYNAGLSRAIEIGKGGGVNDRTGIFEKL